MEKKPAVDLDTRSIDSGFSQVDMKATGYQDNHPRFPDIRPACDLRVQTTHSVQNIDLKA
jgi:hypothetical protein